MESGYVQTSCVKVVEEIYTICDSFRALAHTHIWLEHEVKCYADGAYTPVTRAVFMEEFFKRLNSGYHPCDVSSSLFAAADFIVNNHLDGCVQDAAFGT